MILFCQNLITQVLVLAFPDDFISFPCKTNFKTKSYENCLSLLEDLVVKKKFKELYMCTLEGSLLIFLVFSFR